MLCLKGNLCRASAIHEIAIKLRKNYERYEDPRETTNTTKTMWSFYLMSVILVFEILSYHGSAALNGTYPKLEVSNASLNMLIFLNTILNHKYKHGNTKVINAE